MLSSSVFVECRAFDMTYDFLWQSASADEFVMLCLKNNITPLILDDMLVKRGIIPPPLPPNIKYLEEVFRKDVERQSQLAPAHQNHVSATIPSELSGPIFSDTPLFQDDGQLM